MYTIEQLKLLRESLYKISDRGLEDDSLERNFRRTDYTSQKLLDNNIVCAAGPFVYGIPMNDVEITLSIINQLLTTYDAISFTKP